MIEEPQEIKEPQAEQNMQEEPVDYQEALEQTARIMIRFKKAEYLIRRMTAYMVKTLKVEHAGILIYSKGEGHYILIESQGTQGRKLPTELFGYLKEDPFIQFFARMANFIVHPKGALIYEDIIKFAEDGTKLANFAKRGIKKTNLYNIRKQMEILKAEIIIPSYYKKDFLGCLILGRKVSGEKFSDREISLFVTFSSDVAMAIKNAEYKNELLEKYKESERQRKEINRLYGKVRQDYRNLELVLSRVVDTRDGYTFGHSLTMSTLGKQLCPILRKEMGMDIPQELEKEVHLACITHDLGKIGVPDKILHKKGKLTRNEWKIMRAHAQMGSKVLEIPGEIRKIAKIVRHHQERYDGKGYPDGLRGKEIPLASRIVTVLDSWDAMRSDRPYRKKLSVDRATFELLKGRGSQFDPKILDAFLMLLLRKRIVTKAIISSAKEDISSMKSVK